MSINHRAEAEKHLATASRYLFKDPADTQVAEIAAAIGQGHAALARNEEQAATTADLRDAITLLRRREYAMRELIATHIVEALASDNAARSKPALHLARDLDEAGANVDDLLNERLRDDPWAAKPDIVLNVPEPVRRVVAGHIAEMLLDSENDAVHKWARGIAYELKRVGLDLNPAIKKRIYDLTLGPDPSEPPF